MIVATSFEPIIQRSAAPFSKVAFKAVLADGWRSGQNPIPYLPSRYPRGRRQFDSVPGYHYSQVGPEWFPQLVPGSRCRKAVIGIAERHSGSSRVPSSLGGCSTAVACALRSDCSNSIFGTCAERGDKKQRYGTIGNRVARGPPRLTRFASRRPGALEMRPERYGHDGAWVRHVQQAPIGGRLARKPGRQECRPFRERNDDLRQRRGEPQAECFHVRLLPRPAVQKRRHGIGSEFELPTLDIREHETCEGFDVGNRLEELDVHSDGPAVGECNDRVTAAMREVELEVSTSALEHGLAVSSIREPDCSWGATEPIGKHTSQGDPSNDVAGAVQIRVETLGPAELIVREPMPEGASGVGPHVQVDVPQVKGRIGHAHA